MASEKFFMLLKILDNENNLTARADQKAISLLSILAVFMVFFIVYYRVIPVNALTVAGITIYFVFAALAILSLIMALRPRIRYTGLADKEEVEAPGIFFAEIRRFPSLSAYRQALEATLGNETDAVKILTRHIYALSFINDTKYKYIQRAVLLVIIAVLMELAIIVYLFIRYMGERAMPNPF